jgi:hypothetical protein
MNQMKIPKLLKTMEPEEAAYLSVIAIPPDGALAVDLTIPIQRQVVDAEEGQEAVV